MSLVPKVKIADGDDQSQTLLSWLLIVLSVILAGVAIAECFCEVRYHRRDINQSLTFSHILLPISFPSVVFPSFRKVAGGGFTYNSFSF